MIPYAYIYDISHATHKLADDLRTQLIAVYGQNPNTSFYEGYSFEELMYWWVVVTIESRYLLTMDSSSSFKGSSALRGLLETLNDTRSIALYRCLRIDCIPPNAIVRLDVFDNYSSLAIVHTNNIIL